MSRRFFTYGTLKRGEPNHHVLNHNVTFVGEGWTAKSYPLVVISPFFVPFLLDKDSQPGAKVCRVKLSCVSIVHITGIAAFDRFRSKFFSMGYPGTTK